MKYDGGYYTIETQLVKQGAHGHTALLPDPVSDEVLAAVNAVQRTPWRINTFVLGVVKDCIRDGGGIAGLSTADPEPLPEDFPQHVWDAMSDAEKAGHKIRRAVVHGRNARMVGRREELQRKLSVANDLAWQESIYFPHALDFRGRLYPVPQDLHPQGDDLAKSLLMFARGVEPGADGIKWLKIALANAFGHDKLGLEERVAWVNTNHEAILDCAKNPLDGGRMWAEAEEPWMFLALSREFYEVSRNGDRALIHVPVNVDATCSGMQHLSAMGLDAVGGRATNLTNTGRREDLYFEVAEECKRIVARDAAAGDPTALRWLGKVTRKTVKRAVMTTPYGVTSQGIREQLVSDGHCDGVEGNPSVNAEYLGRVIEEALEGTVSSARAIMAWLQRVARALAEENIPFDWVTPAGMKVRQAYWGLTGTRIRTLYGSMQLWTEAPGSALDTKKSAMSSAPNFVHSFDAAHLVRTVNRIRGLGVTDFAMIHDSFGTHARDVELMQRVLREEFVSIYSEDWLTKTVEFIRSYAPSVDIPDPPKRGDLDVSEVLRSPFFFS